MRDAFARALVQAAEVDERIVLLAGDIGNHMFDEFKSRYPRRFYNCGVAEANIISVAAGLALSGLRPVAYTIASFITSRCLEQIKIDVCHHDAPVVIVGVLGGAGGAIAEWLTRNTPQRARYLAVGLPDEAPSVAISQRGARETMGLSAEAIVMSVRRELNRGSSTD
jgi:transketolase C-terminal domain/subunit